MNGSLTVEGACCCSYSTLRLDETHQHLFVVVQRWDKEEVEEWLNQHEFEEDVRTALNDARVDGPALLRLDDLALQSIGVNKLGDRKRLLRYIRRIHNSCFFLDQGNYITAHCLCFFLFSTSPFEVLTCPLRFVSSSFLLQTQIPIGCYRYEVNGKLTHMFARADPRTWDASDVGTWLALCGLEEYRELFSAATVTGRLLLSLDDWELRQIGVTKLGHRKQILRRASEAKLRPKRRLAAYPLPTQWTMLEVCDWLKVIQLDQYRQLFLNNRIAGEQLMSLTELALCEMGIASLGHRKRLLKEIASVKPDPKLLDPEMQSSAHAIAAIPAAEPTISPPSSAKRSTSVVELRKQKQVAAMLVLRTY